MPTFNEHIHQAKSNLAFLREINSKSPKFVDWQITTCFYVAVHLINAHGARRSNVHFKDHTGTAKMIAPGAGPCEVPQHVNNSYHQLSILSRKSRYLSEGESPHACPAMTHRQLAKAIRHLDIIMDYFVKEHQCSFDLISLVCTGNFRQKPRYFTIVTGITAT